MIGKLGSGSVLEEMKIHLYKTIVHLSCQTLHNTYTPLAVVSRARKTLRVYQHSLYMHACGSNLRWLGKDIAEIIFSKRGHSNSHNFAQYQPIVANDHSKCTRGEKVKLFWMLPKIWHTTITSTINFGNETYTDTHLHKSGPTTRD
jgi:acyl-CoA hydrolase